MHYLYHSKSNPLPDSPPLILNVETKGQPSLFPPINANRFINSAKEYENLFKEAQLVIKKIIQSAEFAEELMHEAQHSNQKKVDELIKSAGVHYQTVSAYTPSGIQIKVYSPDGCCFLEVGLLW